MTNATAPVLAVSALSTEVRTERGLARVLDNVAFEVPSGGKVALVGESGCGKMMTALSIMRLQPPSPICKVQGQVWFQGRDVLSLPEREMRKLRGNEMAMVFQEPTTSLNPVLTVGYQIAETLRAHQRVTRKAARSRAIELLGRVGIPSPSERVDAYPHQLSGGMCQRVMIAIAMCCQPALIIADEPTTSLDVTTQAAILQLLNQVRMDDRTAMLLITHDLGVVTDYANHVLVMYAGQIVESAPVKDIFQTPKHPYTQAMLRSLPPTLNCTAPRLHRLPTIEGPMPDPTAWPSGCRFHHRCPHVCDLCRDAPPPWVNLDADVGVRCILAAEGAVG